jgi:hypothetical protein
MNLMLNRLYQEDVDSDSIPTQFQIGIGSTAPNAADTALEIRVPITDPTTINDCSTADWTESTDATADATNTTNYKIGGGNTDDTAISMGKSGTVSVDAYYSNTVGATSMTGKWLMAWFKVKDATALAKLDLATNSGLNLLVSHNSFTNYDYWQWGRDTLAVGWNLLIAEINSPDGDDGTGATTSAITDYRIHAKTNNTSDTLTAADLVMDYWHLVQESDFAKDFEVDGVTFDTPNRKTTVEGRVTAAQANGYLLSEVGEFNEDGTPKLISHDTVDTISKDSKEEIIWEWVHQVNTD